jgi:phosphohistidine phosphatase
MKLLVIRHGPAGDAEKWRAEGRDDRLRPLTPDGKDDMRQVAAGLATMIPQVDVLLSSPLIRASQTAQIVADEYHCKIETTDALLPEKDSEATLRELKTRPEQTIGVVGHEPHLSAFITFLLAGKPESFIDLKKGGACLLELESAAPGSATLQWLLTRRELGRLGEV